MSAPRPPPTIHEYDAWKATLMEHRRALFERLVAAFPTELANRRSDLEQWRIRLSGPRINVGYHHHS
jgi:hypothetical protein